MAVHVVGDLPSCAEHAFQRHYRAVLCARHAMQRWKTRAILLATVTKECIELLDTVRAVENRWNAEVTETAERKLAAGYKAS